MIVLMTDFGESEYVGMMKGVIASISPSTRIEDLTHTISPQSVRDGAWVLLQSYKYFPKETIFVCVIDPGVGTERAAILVRTNNYVFVGPDNGLLSPAIHDDGIVKIVEVSIDEPISTTFHGRDIFAKVGAYTAQNLFDKFIQSMKDSLDIILHFHLEGRCGEIVHIDHFGNIITNLSPLEKDEYKLIYKDLVRDIRWVRTYDEGIDEDHLPLYANGLNQIWQYKKTGGKAPSRPKRRTRQRRRRQRVQQQPAYSRSQAEAIRRERAILEAARRREAAKPKPTPKPPVRQVRRPSPAPAPAPTRGPLDFTQVNSLSMLREWAGKHIPMTRLRAVTTEMKRVSGGRVQNGVYHNTSLGNLVVICEKGRCGIFFAKD